MEIKRSKDREFPEMCSNYLEFSTALINLGDLNCYYRITGLSLKVKNIPYKPSEFYEEIIQKQDEQKITQTRKLV